MVGRIKNMKTIDGWFVGWIYKLYEKKMDRWMIEKRYEKIDGWLNG